MSNNKYFFLKVLFLFLSPFYMVISLVAAIFSRFMKNKNCKLRLVWGSKPLIPNTYWSNCMSKVGFYSTTFVDGYSQNINKKEDWDVTLQEKYIFIPFIFRPFVAFIHSLFLYDVFFISFSGFFIGQTPLWWIQAYIFKIAKKKVIVIPYGGDSYVYSKIKSTCLIHALMISYPEESRNQRKISQHVDYWCKHADVVITHFMSPDGFGRWDVFIPSLFIIDLELWRASKRKNYSNGGKSPVIITHAPNHRGFKGTEFIIDAIEVLKSEGLNVELRLIEGMQNSELKKILLYETDILVEQIIFTGYGFNGLEGMATGLPVISNLEDENYTLMFRRWSYFNECPIASASPETLVNVLRRLVTDPELRHKLGHAGVEYANKYHSNEAGQFLFREVIEYSYGRRKSLINMYHPLLGEYPKKKPYIDHPLINNHIVD